MKFQRFENRIFHKIGWVILIGGEPVRCNMPRTYGAELECYGLYENELREVIESVVDEDGNPLVYGGHFSYHGSRSLGTRCKENGNGNLWVSENDGSLSGCNPSPQGRGHEVVSPVLVGEAGLRTLGRVMTALSNAGAKVNVKCGTHITLGVENCSARFRRMGASAKAQCYYRIVEAYDYFEDAFNQLVSASRRYGSNSTNSYGGCRNYLQHGQTFGNVTKAQAREEGTLRCGRGQVNIQASKGLIEFRNHNGTLNRNKIYSWALLLDKLVSWGTTQEHENFGCDLREFAPTFEGLMAMLKVGSDLRRALESRRLELFNGNLSRRNGNRNSKFYLPSIRYIHDYEEYRDIQLLQQISDDTGVDVVSGWV